MVLIAQYYYKQSTHRWRLFEFFPINNPKTNHLSITKNLSECSNSPPIK